MFTIAEPRARGQRVAQWFVLATAVTSAVAADWAERAIIDPRSGDALEAPGARNPDGFQLDLLRDAEDGSVIGVFRLPPGERDFLDASRPPALALDQGAERSVILLEGGLTWAAFPVWNGHGEAATGLLRDLMQAARLEVTYFLHGGGYKSTRFALDGAASLLAKAFDLPERLSEDEVATARELETAIEAEGVRCLELKGRRRERCLDAARTCIDQATDAAALRACLARSEG